jgi:CRP-like cAMP-binding protein
MLKGRSKTIKASEDGRELITGIYKTDDYFGMNALLADEMHAETATAMEDGSYCMLPADTVKELLSRFTDIGTSFIKILSNNIKEKESQLMQMAYHSVRKRMAELILHLSSQQESKDLNECLPVTREEMASMAGMASETVSRILSDFAAEKLIEKEKKLIRILDKTRLTNLQN